MPGMVDWPMKFSPSMQSGMERMSRTRGIFCGGLMIAVITEIAFATPASAEELIVMVSGAIGPGALLIAVLALSVCCIVLWMGCRRMLRRSDDQSATTIAGRDMPALVARQDGTIIEANAAIGQQPRMGTVLDVLAQSIAIEGPEIYRLARAAIADGFAIEQVSHKSSDEKSALVVMQTGPDRLIWQIMSEQKASGLLPDRPGSREDEAPYAYVRLSPVDGIVTNRLFNDVFSEDAIRLLSDEIDSGVFTAGRMNLPGRDGSERLTLVALKVERSPENDVYELFLFVPDAETSSQISAAETLDAIPVSLLRLDIEGRVLWGNEQARTMLGPAFKVGDLLNEIVRPLGRSFDNVLDEVRNNKDRGSGEMVHLTAGEFDSFAQVSLTRMTLQGQPTLMAVLTDASELRLLEDKFAQSSKMEAVGKLAGGVAHDFNNVLTAISGHCDLLLLRKDASHPDFSDLTQIRQNSNRAATLVRQLLAFSRKQTLQPKLLSVQDVVSDTLYLLDRLIGETITLSLDLDRDLGPVRADNQQLEQAIMNLVVNARDAMPQGGVITIATCNRRVEADEQRLGVAIPPGQYVQISVSDNGTGVDVQHIDKVFDPFFTTKPLGEGTGLGLSTVYGIVKQSGGYIYVENVPNSGACFTILLPEAEPVTETAEEPAEVEDTPAPAAPDLTGQGAVMLVEDEAPVRSFASRALKMRGYKVIEAESAEDAMDLLEETTDAIDVLVSDVVMPGMDGPTFATKAREVRPGLRVIFISGYAEDSFRRNLKDDDFLFLPKPFSLNELTAKVKMAMVQHGGARH